VLRGFPDDGLFRFACITVILMLAIWRLSQAGLAQVLFTLIDFAERRRSKRMRSCGHGNKEVTGMLTAHPRVA